jgi:uncharacterized protein (DUF2164 family)
MPLELDKEVRALAVKSIERYFIEELVEKIGNIRAAALLGFSRTGARRPARRGEPEQAS